MPNYISKKKIFGSAALSGLALIASLSLQERGSAQVSSKSQAPMDADDGADTPTLDSQGVPLDKAVVAKRKVIADCLLKMFRIIPDSELGDYSQTVGFYLPHKVSEAEAEWIDERIKIAVDETTIAKHSPQVEQMVLRPTKVSAALEFCLAPKPTI